MRSNSFRAIFVSAIMILSSLVGCISDDVESKEEGALGTVVVSTYHIEQLVSAVAGDIVDVQILSPSNVPVHDYEPSAADLISLQTSDMFFYHGLNLEPWVESTLSALAGDAPTTVMTHAMPSGQNSLDYESLLISELCEHLTEGATEFITLGEHKDDLNESDELHAEHVTYNLAFPEHDEHDEHDEGNETHDDHDEGNDTHDNHDQHEHAQPQETIINPVTCPSETVIYIFHLEAGEVLIEFESEIELENGFDMIALPMGGGHAAHAHAEEVHDEHDEGNEAHDEHDEGNETHDEHDEGNETHDEHDEDEGHEVGYAVLHIEQEGEYGIALPHDVELFLMMDEHEAHGDHGNTSGEEDHDEHDEETEGEHDEEGHEEDLAFDPHSWLDPLAFKAQVNVVMENLSTLFPSQEATFKANAEAYIAQLDGLHADYEAAFSDSGTCTDSTVVANHAAYNYLANRYDIEFITLHGVDPEGEPSAEDIATVIEQIEDEGITVFFIEEFTSVDAVQSIIDQTTSATMPTGVSIQYLYTMELPPSDSNDNYLSLMKKNLQNLKAGLGC